MIILDTDIFSIIQRRTGDVYERLAERMARKRDESFCVTVITLEEQTRGWLAYIAKSKSSQELIHSYLQLESLVRDFSDWMLLSFDHHAARLLESIKSQKIRLSSMDMRIAAIAMSHQAILITRNVRDFQKVPGLRVEDWTVN